MAYENQCGTCCDFKDKRYGCSDPFDIRYANSEKGYCDYHKCFYWADDSCSHHRDRSSYVPGGCYITTIVCDVLEFEDDCSVLTTLRNFRDKIMQPNIEYRKLLFEYDTVGPVLADLIEDEYKKTNDKEMWIQYYNFYLVPTTNFVAANNYDEAVSRYREMIESLKEYFAIEDTNQVNKYYDMTQGGHGKMKILSFPTENK